MPQFQGFQFELPPFAQKLIERGEVRGAIKGKREAIFKLAARAGFVLSEEQRARVEACDDLDELDRWFDRAIAAKTAEEIFD